MTDNDFNPVVELQAEVEANPTLEIQAQVEMGGVASEYNAEAWAVGQRGGTDVPSTDQTYHNNSKYYAETVAQGKVEDAEAWAVGQRGGTDVPSTDPAYENSAKYWADQAAAIVAGDIVDDDAGIGDLLKVWSADKDVKELDKKAPVIEGAISTEAAVQDFADGANGMPMRVVVGVEPVQDLHGYDYPWIGGEGKNLINAPDVTLAEAGDVFNGACKLAAGTYTLSSSNTSVSVSVAGVSGTMPLTFTLADAVTTLQITASGAGTFNNIQIESGSSATDFAPYENICPISGWTGCKITRTGKNLLGGTALRDALLTAIPSASHDATNKVVHFTASSASAKKIVSREYKEGYAVRLPFKENTQYSFIFTGYNANTTTGTTNINIYYTDGTSDNPWFNSTAAEKSTRVFVSDAGKTIAYITGAYNKGTSYFYYEECGVFEGVLTAADFEPYQGNVYNISFPSEAGTVYGGELTVNKDGSGTLVSEYDFAETNAEGKLVVLGYGSAVNWFGNISSNYAYCVVNDSNTGVIAASDINSLYKHGTNIAGTGQEKTLRVYRASANSRLRIIDNSIPGFSTAETSSDMAAAVATYFAGLYAQGIKLQAIWKLSTPAVFQLTPGQVKSLLGYNALWADTGNIKSVDYCADTKLYIDSFNPVPSMIAANNIASGKYFMVGNMLYISTAAIAQGATITPGTNCTAISLADALNTITE